MSPTMGETALSHDADWQRGSRELARPRAGRSNFTGEGQFDGKIAQDRVCPCIAFDGRHLARSEGQAGFGCLRGIVYILLLSQFVGPSNNTYRLPAAGGVGG